MQIPCLDTAFNDLQFAENGLKIELMTTGFQEDSLRSARIALSKALYKFIVQLDNRTLSAYFQAKATELIQESRRALESAYLLTTREEH